MWGRPPKDSSAVCPRGGEGGMLPPLRQDQAQARAARLEGGGDGPQGHDVGLSSRGLRAFCFS